MTAEFRCIAVETATEHCSVAVSHGEASIVTQLTSARDSSREVYNAITAALDEVDLKLKDLDCVAFGCGPGSFTGLRVAASVAQALAYSRSLPVCRISTLAALAHNAYAERQHRHIAACLDARMGEVYIGRYQFADNGQCMALQPDQLLTPDDVTLDSMTDGWLAAGAGWSVWPEMTKRNSHIIGSPAVTVWPDAGAVLELARKEFAAGNTVAAAAALPNYIREQVTG